LTFSPLIWLCECLETIFLWLRKEIMNPWIAPLNSMSSALQSIRSKTNGQKSKEPTNAAKPLIILSMRDRFCARTGGLPALRSAHTNHL
jgi:hypothetical protein